MYDDSRYTQISDEELIVELRAGSTQIADYLLDKYKNLVRSKARAMYLVGGDNDDLIQEGMIGLYKAIRDYNPKKEAPFSSFAKLCITRQLYTAVEASLRKKHMPLNTYISLNAEENADQDLSSGAKTVSAADNRNPEELVLAQETVVAIQAEISNCLSQYEKEVFSMYLEGLNYSQIAKNLGKEPKSVDNALQRIKMKLKKRL